MKNILVVLAVLLLCFPAYAQDEKEVTNAGVTPDSMLWSVDRAAEGASLFFTFDEQARAEKRLRYAQERLDEAKVMIAAQDIDAAQKAQMAHARSLVAVQRDVSTLTGDDVTEELQKKVELQRTIESQQEQVIQIQNKIEIRVRGQLTPEQKEKLDALLRSFSEETATTEDAVELEKEKAELKLRAIGEKGIVDNPDAMEPSYFSAGVTCDSGANTRKALGPEGIMDPCQPISYWKKTGVEWCKEQGAQLRDLDFGVSCGGRPATPPRPVPPKPNNPLFSSAKFSCDDDTSVTEGMTVQEGQKPICRDYAAWKAMGVKYCTQKGAQLIDIEMGTSCNAPPPNGDVLVTLNTPFELKVGQQARLENMEVIAFYQESLKQSCATPIPAPVQCPQYSSPAPGWCAEGSIMPGKIDENGCRAPPRCIASSTKTEDKQIATATAMVPTEQQPIPMPTSQKPIAIPTDQCGAVAFVVLSAVGNKDVAKLRMGESLAVGTFRLQYLAAYPENNAGLFELQMSYGDDTPVSEKPTSQPRPVPVPVPAAPVGFHAATYVCSNGMSTANDAGGCIRQEDWKASGVKFCASNGANLIDLKLDGSCDFGTMVTETATASNVLKQEVAKSATVR